MLFIDDDEDVLKAAEFLMRRHGMAMTTARNPIEAWSALAATPVDVILLDLNFSRGSTSGEEGLQCLSELMANDPEAVVVVVTGHSGVNIAVSAMRAGASDFVMKPWSNERLIATVNTALELRQGRRRAAALRAENDALSTEAWGQDALVLGDSPAIVRVRDIVARAAPTDASVLIYGAAGTGKSLLARAIHRQSLRATGPFIPVDLATLGETDVEAVLLGDRRSGRETPGMLEAARGGTLFLDEVDALARSVQVKLLTAIEQRCVAAIGTDRLIALDFRIVAATRQRREDLQGRNGLLSDLFYRLNTIEIFAPSLADRNGDALRLAEHYLRTFARRYGRPAKALTPEAATAITADPWPGDVRALRQAMERCVIFSQGEQYGLTDIPWTEAPPTSDPPARTNLNLKKTEQSLIAAALKQHSFNVSHAARELGLTRAALYRRMAKYGF